MPTLMPFDTMSVLGNDARQCDSRTLFLEKFCDPQAKEDNRKQAFLGARKTPPSEILKLKAQAWRQWLLHVTKRATPRNEDEHNTIVIYAQLQARLMVNMAGGVMENAGLCLDRFGLPYIPGSAVKGCARRAALAALREWCLAGGSQENKPRTNENPLAACCEPFTDPAEMLAAIAQVFGWCEQDWTENSDLPWACAKKKEILHAAAETLAERFKWPIENRRRNTPWRSLPNFAGSVSFLPAYPLDLSKTGPADGLPLEVPPLGKLELDVVTCHHRQYYEGELPVATDTEDPNPVVFPAVAPGHVFAFALLPLRNATSQLLEYARTWLKTGLEVFGLGAKTNAGYGWFNATDTVQLIVKSILQAQAEKEEIERKRQEEEARRKAEEEERRRRAEEYKEATKNMTPEQKADYDIALLTEAQFQGRLEEFLKRPVEEQKAIVRALRLPSDDPKSRRKFWEELKRKAQKGGKYAQIEQAIRKLSKEMFPGKEGKMP